jgi:flagellar biosynthetic protein FlhB
LAEAGKSLLKLAAIGFAVWQVLARDVPALTRLPFQDPRLLLSQAGPPVFHVLLVVLAAQAVIAGIDVFLVRLRHARRLRMSRQDVRDELRESDGDPKIKARIRQIRLQRARKRMMAAVPKATVVVTNPTHYAVALTYDRAKNAAPRVVAKGVDSMAARIREVAEASRVPLVANPPLARALYQVELDRDIPAEHYQAVAEIIAYVWRLGQRARPRRAA